MNKKRLLIQLQLSNYDSNKKFVLECDSGWQMMSGRILEMLKHNDELVIDVICPLDSQVKTKPEELIMHFEQSFVDRINFLKTSLIANALVTRYDFNFSEIESLIKPNATEYTHVYMNDPMLLRHYKSLFYLAFKHKPKFVTHSHFIDNPENPKVPTEVSYWHGQVEAALKSDYNFWQCESSMNVFFESMSKQYSRELVEQVKNKSEPWDDGYSTTEINEPIDYNNLRFRIPEDKIVVFVPNRVGGMGRSFDYTNAGKFLFEIVNEVYNEREKDFIVLAGNPSQKFSNDELDNMCKPYLKLIPDTPTRNEYRYIARRSHINVGLYDNDSYGGTAWRECIDLGCMPLSIRMYEYKAILEKINYEWICKEDFSDIKRRMHELINFSKQYSKVIDDTVVFENDFGLRKEILERCSYEHTTKNKMKKIGLL